MTATAPREDRPQARPTERRAVSLFQPDIVRRALIDSVIKLVDSDIVKEVISDLDISRHTTRRRPVEVEEDFYEPAMPGPVAVTTKKEERPREELSPSEAAAYMQEVALKLKNWQQSMDKTLSSTPRRQRPIRTDG